MSTFLLIRESVVTRTQITMTVGFDYRETQWTASDMETPKTSQLLFVFCAQLLAGHFYQGPLSVYLTHK